MVLKTGRKCKWEDIEVGEVFAVNACWAVFEKISKEEALLLDSDVKGWQEDYDGYSGNWGRYVKVLCSKNVYKLPLSVQRLWKEE